MSDHENDVERTPLKLTVPCEGGPNHLAKSRLDRDQTSSDFGQNFGIFEANLFPYSAMRAAASQLWV
jgi:hypothetical protein